jgi:hypothetical protein
VAITGRSLGDAATRFATHLNSVLGRTLTQAPLTILIIEGKPHALLSFRRDGAPVGVLLRSSFGSMYLWIGQTCGAEENTNGSQRLYTARYRYTITIGENPEPLLRWEYEKTRPNAAALWCRHHLQGPIAFKLGETTVALNDWHLPTGYVPLEEVIRFCIVDLKVNPISADWDRVLIDSYQRFKTEFTSA